MRNLRARIKVPLDRLRSIDGLIDRPHIRSSPLFLMVRVYTRTTANSLPSIRKCVGTYIDSTLLSPSSTDCNFLSPKSYNWRTTNTYSTFANTSILYRDVKNEYLSIHVYFLLWEFYSIFQVKNYFLPIYMLVN